MTLGEKIKSARKQAGISQVQLGSRIGVSGTLIGQYETGRRVPDQEMLENIKWALEIDDQDYFENESNFEPLEEEAPQIEPIRIETMNVLAATEYLRACGLKLSPETLRLGILQGVFPFGSCIMNGGRVSNCIVYTHEMIQWVKARAGAGTA